MKIKFKNKDFEVEVEDESKWFSSFDSFDLLHIFEFIYVLKNNNLKKFEELKGGNKNGNAKC